MRYSLARDNETGVSRRHIRIDISPVLFCPRLTVLSRNAVRVHIGARTVILEQGHSLDVVSLVTINLGEITFKTWRPILWPKDEQCYRQNAERFSNDFLDGLRKFPVKLDDTGASTFNLRFGENDTVYKMENSGPASTGSFASVIKVKELRSQKIFAAKVPHFKSSDPPSIVRHRWEFLTEEFHKIVKLQHVSDFIQ